MNFLMTYTTHLYSIADTNSSLNPMQAKVVAELLQQLQVGEAPGHGFFFGVYTTMPKLYAGRGSLGLYEPVSKGGVQRCS